MPSLLAATQPSTTVGNRDVDASRKRPAPTDPLSCASRLVVLASTDRPEPSLRGARSERRTTVCVFATAAALVTGPMRATRATASVDSLTGGSPGAGSARNMLVPKAVSSSSSARWLVAGMPVTTIIVAMPIAMPSADSAARNRRAVMPSSPSRSTSPKPTRTGRKSVRV
jgi:hypothetical protein